MNVTSRSILISGKVQGVWFRKYTADKANELGVKGTVQNLPSGQVLIHAVGSTPLVDALEKWCWLGSPESEVRDVVSKEIEARPYSSFDIIG